MASPGGIPRPFDLLLQKMNADSDGNLRSTVARSGVVLIVRQGLLMAFSIIGVLVKTRIIGPTDYGIYSSAASIHGFIAGIFGLGMEAYLIRGASDLSDRDCNIASTFLLTVGICCGIAEAILISAFGNRIGLSRAIPVAALLPIQLISTPAAARLDRKFLYHRAVTVDLVGVVTYYVLTVSLAFAGWGAWALATGWAAQTAVNSFGYHVAARWCPRPTIAGHALRKMIAYSISFSASNWIWQARSLVNPIIVGNLLGIEAVGIVSLAQRLVGLLSFTQPIVWRVAMAAFARIQNEPRKLARAIEDGMELQALAIGPPLVIFAVFGRDLTGIIFGARWLPAFDVFPYLALASFGIAMFTLHSSALAVYMRNLDVVAFNTVNLVILAVSTYFLVPVLGAKAIGVADVVALSSLVLLDLSFRRRIGPISYLNALPIILGVALALLLSGLSRLSALLPLVALAWPGTWTRLLGHFHSVLKKRESPPARPDSAC
jgi:O-antigen/teichoic acid export membrane protein